MAIGDVVRVHDRMQQGYSYRLEAAVGRSFAPDFKPALTPAEMLKLGVFEGRYCNDCSGEFPASWFRSARLSDQSDASINCFGIKSRQPLSVWRQNGWIIEPDPRGWFQWYCRYYLGRRMPGVDARQIRRWNAMRRHVAQVRRHCDHGDQTCRKRQRQALLHWAYDSRKI